MYAPGLGAMEEAVWQAMGSAACVLVDGTFWSDDEMIRLGMSKKRARDIGHLPQSGPGGMLEWLQKLPADTRRILIHINNTNPILDEDSAERAGAARAAASRWRTTAWRSSCERGSLVTGASSRRSCASAAAPTTSITRST